jgi:replication factor C subunit 2/4
MQQSFLKKYQPKFYKDFIIDKSYIQLLTTLKKMDNLNILIIGNSGCGKTSLLDATIREYYNTETIPRHNVLYINNLKDQGIQYYRNEVKTFCQTTSNIVGLKKFIVLDDIDSINEQSQQVFRNCIDKYNHNVHFISSCLNTQKVIESIQSRCAIIKIKPIEKKTLHKILRKIKKGENIEINKTAEEFIINISNNSIRQIINYMEKFKILNTPINCTKVKNICTNINFLDFEKYTNLWYKERDLREAINLIFNIYKKGYSVMDILDCYFFFIKLYEIDEEIKYRIIKIICKYITIFHNKHEKYIELVFFTNDLLHICN